VHVVPEQRARGDGEQDRKRNGNVFGAHGRLRTSPAAASRTPGTRTPQHSGPTTAESWFTYTRSESATNPIIARNVTSARTTIPTVSIAHLGLFDDFNLHVDQLRDPAKSHKEFVTAAKAG
jgi:hypothetical protein